MFYFKEINAKSESALGQHQCPLLTLALSLWHCGAALLLLAKLGPQDLIPTEVKTPLSCVFTLHLLPCRCPVNSTFCPVTENQEGPDGHRRVLVPSAEGMCWRVSAHSSVIMHRERLSWGWIISNCYQCIFFDKEAKEVTALKWKLPRLRRSWKVKYSARTFCVQIQNLKTCICPH